MYSSFWKFFTLDNILVNIGFKNIKFKSVEFLIIWQESNGIMAEDEAFYEEEKNVVYENYIKRANYIWDEYTTGKEKKK